MEVSQRSLRGLDFVAFFMADVKDGVGVYLSAYLLVVHHWDPAQIGVVGSIPWVVSILVQGPVGAFIDYTTRKRLLLIVATIAVAVSCLILLLFPSFYPIVASQIALGIAQTVFPPCLAAMSLGVVGHESFPQRIGRNESFSHAGNMCAAVVAAAVGYYVAYVGIFGLSLFQCVAICVAVLLIKASDIDHGLARSASSGFTPGLRLSGLEGTLRDRQVLALTAAIFLWNIANSAMLPLLGQKLGNAQLEDSSFDLALCIVIAQAVMVVIAPLAAQWAKSRRRMIFLVSFLLISLRAVLFAVVDNRYGLITLQAIDGLGAGIYGVLSVVMLADLAKGTGHFNLLQGACYAVVGLGVALSNTMSGFIVSYFGYGAAFMTLAALGLLGAAYFWFAVDDPLAKGDQQGC